MYEDSGLSGLWFMRLARFLLAIVERRSLFIGLLALSSFSACSVEIGEPTPAPAASSAGGNGGTGGDPCAQGGCGCPDGSRMCAGVCAAVRSDPANCGACGVRCTAEQICDQGSCKARAQGCSGGLADCGGSCVDLQTANANCGQCGIACPASKSCSAGKCVCPEGKQACGDACVDVMTDNANCGACGTACTGGRTCQAGMCACPAGQAYCGSSCVDTRASAEHCGGCNMACSNGKTCVDGSCSCGAGKAQCGDACVDTQTDDRNCGGCDKACSLGQGCSMGRCEGGGVMREDGCSGLAQNLSISQIAIYQTVKIAIMQNGNEIAPAARNTDVITGKEALFRVFITAGSGFTARELSARLFIENAKGVEMFYAKATLRGTTQEADLATSFQIKLPKTALTPDSRYAVEIAECGAPGAGTMMAPRFPATDGIALGARETGVLKIRLVPMQINGTLPDTSEAGLKPYKDRFMALYPISDVLFTVAEPQTFAGASDWTGNLDRMRQLRRADNPPADVYYYGLLKPANSLREFCGNGCTTGIGYVPQGSSANQAAQRVALGIGFSDGPSADTITHEVGHNHGRNHAPCGSGIEGVDGSFPYMGGQIGVYGYDPQTQKLIPPDRTDLMGYCNNKWLSDYTYDGLLNRIVTVNGALDKFIAPEIVRPWNVLLLEGTSVRWGAPIDEPEAPAGEPEPAEILDASGRVIGIETVFRTEISDIGAYSFEVPKPKPGWHSIRVGDAPPLAY